MAKRLAVLVGMLALLLAAVPAFAESEPRLTGVVEKPEVTTYMYGTHSLTDEAGAGSFALRSEVADLDAYVGQRVAVFGASVPEYEDGRVEGGPPLFEVTRVEAAGPEGPPPGSSATFDFELAVECEPPANAEFLGLTATESLVTTPLTDPDGDGVYAGSLSVPRFAPGPTPPGTEPIAISPVRIVQGPPTGYGAMGPEYRVIEDFGAVVAEDTTLSASVSFCEDGTGSGGGGTGNGGGTEPVDLAPVEPAPGGGNGSGNGSAVVSGDTSNADKGGSVGTGGGFVDTSSGGAGRGEPSPMAKVLPATGGVLPVAAAGALLVVGGLLARRIFR